LDRIPGTKAKKFDWFGTVSFIASTVSIMIPMTWGGVMYSWSSWHTLVPLLLGIAGIVSFSFYEWRLSTNTLSIPREMYFLAIRSSLLFDSAFSTTGR
jgi:hypothetical protein